MSFQPFSPSMSSPSPSPKTKKSGKENRCRNETAGGRNGGKIDGGCRQSSDDGEESIYEVVARRRAEKCAVPRLVTSPSQLMWYRRKNNKRELYHPCCVCDISEGGIDGDESSDVDSDVDDKSSSLRIRLISRQSFGQSEKVPRGSLVPYYGGEDDSDEEAGWSRRILGTHHEQREVDAQRKGERLDGSTLMAEAFYLEKVLRVASERSSDSITASAAAGRREPQNRTQQSEDYGNISSGDRREPKSRTSCGASRSKRQSCIQQEEDQKKRRSCNLVSIFAQTGNNPKHGDDDRSGNHRPNL